MQIRTIRNRFEAFETKFEPFEKGIRTLRKPNSIHSKGIRSIRLQIRNIQKGFHEFECTLQQFEKDSRHKHSKGIRSCRNQIRTIQKGFEAFE